MLERQKAWQQQWRERHEREGALYDAVAVVDDVIIGRSVTITCVACAVLHDTAGIQAHSLHVYTPFILLDILSAFVLLEKHRNFTLNNTQATDQEIRFFQ